MTELNWCYENHANLSLQLFANKFGYSSKATANVQYHNILHSKKMAKVPNIKELKRAYSTWTGSCLEAAYWRDKSLEETRKDTTAGLTESALRSMKRLGANEEKMISQRR